MTCPECGKTFTRPAALGAHRRRAHGIAGTSNRTRARKPRTTRATRATRATTTRFATATVRGRRAGNGSRLVDRDALLSALFPNGLPARESVIRAANDWLDQAEQLAAMK